MAKKNFNEYYVKSIKTTFGYVSRPSSIWRLSIVLLPAVIALVAYYLYFGGFNGRNMKVVGDW